MKLYKILIFLLLAVSIASPEAYSQMEMGEKYIVISKGQSYKDTIETQFASLNFFVENCRVVTRNIGGRQREVTISPPQNNLNYLGKARAFSQYVDNLRPHYIEYHITFQASIITTQDDYKTFSSNNPVDVQPLSNDLSTASGLHLSGIAFVQGGTATFTNDTLTFTPEADIDQGYVLYSVKDDEGTSMNGVVYFLRDGVVFEATDTISYTIKNTQTQKLVLPTVGFSLQQQGLLGHVDSLYGRVFEYTPQFPDFGSDTLVFTHADGYSYTFLMNILSLESNTSSVRNDVVFTPKNTSVSFDVFANDLADHFSIANYSPELVRDTLGVFTYTPPLNFSGVKDFTYTVRYANNHLYTGDIKIFIGNYNPNNSLDYEFSTAKNKSLVVNYDVPIEDYNFEILNNPLFGTVEIFENENVQEDCNEFWSKSTLIYTPDNNYFGQDSFDVEYCVVNSGCLVYKVYINVLDHNQDTLCLCQGPGCVWEGDFNGDGYVSVRDILALGRYLGLSGPDRVDTAWPMRSGHDSDDWLYTQSNGYNIKHVDANGDGLISIDDAEAIDDNYGVHHRFVPTDVLGSKDLEFDLQGQVEDYEPGDLAVIDIVLGTDQNPVEDLFGLVFGLNINPSVMDSASLEVSFDKSSWLTQGDGSLQMYKQPLYGQVEAALSKVSSIVVDELEGFKPNGSSGNGIIGQLVFIVVDELEGFKSSSTYHTSRIYTNGIEIEDVEGWRYKLPDTFIDLKINKTTSQPEPTEDKLILYPNPAQNDVLLHFNGRNSILDYTVFDAMGQMVISRKNINAQSERINISAFSEGIYVVQVTTTKGTINKKLYVANKK